MLDVGTDLGSSALCQAVHLHVQHDPDAGIIRVINAQQHSQTFRRCLIVSRRPHRIEHLVAMFLRGNKEFKQAQLLFGGLPLTTVHDLMVPSGPQCVSVSTNVLICRCPGARADERTVTRGCSYSLTLQVHLQANAEGNVFDNTA